MEHLETKPRLYVLIGVPAAGKSTWVIDNQSWMSSMAYISTDQYVEEYAISQCKTYSEVFDDYMPSAIERMTDAVIDARESNRDIIWDQTSTTIASRKRKFRMLPNYYKIGVVFKTPDYNTLQERLQSRPGKIIPPEVVHNMIINWEEPTLEEGFDEVWFT